MALPEGLKQCLVADLLGIEHYEHNLVVARATGAHFLVGRVGRDTAGVAHRRHPDAISHLPELALGAPEATESEHRHLEAVWIGAFERALAEEVHVGSGDWLGAAFKCAVGGWHLELFAGKQHGFRAVALRSVLLIWCS